MKQQLECMRWRLRLKMVREENPVGPTRCAVQEREVKGGVKHNSLNDGMYLSNEGLLWSTLVPLEHGILTCIKQADVYFPLYFSAAVAALHPSRRGRVSGTHRALLTKINCS